MTLKSGNNELICRNASASYITSSDPFLPISLISPELFYHCPQAPRPRRHHMAFCTSSSPTPTLLQDFDCDDDWILCFDCRARLFWPKSAHIELCESKRLRCWDCAMLFGSSLRSQEVKRTSWLKRVGKKILGSAGDRLCR